MRHILARCHSLCNRIKKRKYFGRRIDGIAPIHKIGACDFHTHADKVEKGHKEPQIYQDRQHRGFYRSQEPPAFMLDQLGKSNQRRKQADVQRQLRRNDVRLQDPDKSDCKIIPLVRIPEKYFIQAKRGQWQKHHGQHFSDRASYINTQQAI